MNLPKRDTYSSGMAGEFFVMSQLFRLGISPALTLGNSKGIDILLKASDDQILMLEVKTIKGGGKWPVGRTGEIFSTQVNKFHILLHYKNFAELDQLPEVFVIPTPDLEGLKDQWHPGTVAVFQRAHMATLNNVYKDRWDRLQKKIQSDTVCISQP